MNTFHIFFLLLPTLLVHRSSPEDKVMKRESGANPEQTRCCEFLYLLLRNSMPLSGCRMGRLLGTEQVRRPASDSFVLMLSGNKAIKISDLIFYLFSFNKKETSFFFYPLSLGCY